ncbi:MAG TPA: 16S rRNA (uracil(1498)-N(3))-methyltransferase [Beijerinckiaceae bacterium]|nr:16S rRNA (uracil(1498)-N(3))-methyltransferase [Beijerinckiaceae bacterium]
MPRYDFSSHRLFVTHPLTPGASIALTREQANYLVSVLRLQEGDGLLIFNGSDGEWRARLHGGTRKAPLLECLGQVRPQPPAGDLWLVFAPLKSARLDYMVQKAVEMGASRLVPVITRRTQVARVNLARMQANAMEAAEQCGILAVPEVAAESRLDQVLAQWPAGRTLVFCDEDAESDDPLAALAGLGRDAPKALLIGPEGGFDPTERDLLSRVPGCVRLSLGPRILRADTAAVAALALVQAVAGDMCA